MNVTVQTGKPQSSFASGFDAGVAASQARVANAPYQLRAEDISQKERIEHELFRRWQAGDRGAKLPVFDGLGAKAETPQTK